MEDLLVALSLIGLCISFAMVITAGWAFYEYALKPIIKHWWNLWK